MIFGGAPSVGEGRVADLSLTGCSVEGGQTVLAGSYIRLSVFLSDPIPPLLFELGKVRWVRAHRFGVEFIRFPRINRRQLDREQWKQWTTLLEARSRIESIGK